MGKIRTYPQVKIIAAITYAPAVNLAKVFGQLEELLSEIDSQSDPYSFDFTDYYLSEMGSDLNKIMVSFRDLVLADMLPDIKTATNLIEKKLMKENGRTVNIDPGYICAAKLVLATTKDYDHRIYLNRGIFGDVHLRFRGGKFQPNEWTYPDYRQERILRFLEEVRAQYLEKLGRLNTI